jgi:site-specific recombinase XerD
MNALVILRKDYIKKDGTSQLYLRLIIGQKKKDYSLGLHVKHQNWDDKAQKVKTGDPYYKKQNIIINQNLSKAKGIILDARIKDKQLTFKEFELYFRKLENHESFFEFVANEIEEREKIGLASQTLKSYRSYFTKLKTYKTDISFSEANSMEFAANYTQYMREKRQNGTNTLHKNLSFISRMLGIAKEKGLIGEIYFNFEAKALPGKREYLAMQELEKLENLIHDTRLKTYQLKTLEYFLFACYTGLRYSDLKTLKYKEIVYKDVFNEESGKIEPRRFIQKLMNKTANSTGTTVEIPLIKKADKIAGNGLPEQLVFHVNANQVCNRYSKELMELAGIDKNISMHCARHTFATHGLTLGIPIEVVSKLLGHSNLKTTQIYAKIVDSSKVKAMDRWEK